MSCKKENVTQAIVVVDHFDEEFVPLTEEQPFGLIPFVNRPLIDYTLEFLSLGGIEETFVFTSLHIDVMKKYLQDSVQRQATWSLAMKVEVIASETCRSFGDCLRDIDAKGLLRGDFILVEPGTVSNVDLVPLLKKHAKTCQEDKGCAMTILLNEAGIGYHGRGDQELLVATNNNQRILYHKKLMKNNHRKVDFPLEIFLDNTEVNIKHNLKDTQIAVCSSSVLPLFSDNFDFQTKDDFVRGLLLNEEILGSTVYCHILKGNQFGGTITNWRSYQTLSHELIDNWIFPLVVDNKENCIKNYSVVANNSLNQLDRSNCICRSVIGRNVRFGKNVKIIESFVFDDCLLEDGVTVSHSVVGRGCSLLAGCLVGGGSVLGEGVVLPANVQLNDCIVQRACPQDFQEADKLGDKAFKLRLEAEEDLDDLRLSKRLSRLHLKDHASEDELDDGFSDEDQDSDSLSNVSMADDTKLFFTEVVDSLKRGFDDQLLCDNLILEINSSRYAYNVTVKEVNFNVVKAILLLSLRQTFNAQYASFFTKLIKYFVPLLKNYIRSEAAMQDALEAIQEVASSRQEVHEKWTILVLKYLYEQDHLTEEAILKFAEDLDEDDVFLKHAKPFLEWLEEAEEEDDEESE